nr:hypothetical protein [Streptomyces sp. Ncost-T10-10d]
MRRPSAVRPVAVRASERAGAPSTHAGGVAGPAQAVVDLLEAFPSARPRSVAEHIVQDGPGGRAELGGRGVGEDPASVIEAHGRPGRRAHLLLRPGHARMVSHAT